MRWAIKPFPRPGRIGSPHRQVRLCAQAHLTLQTLRPQDFDVESPADVAPDHHPSQSVIRRSGVVAHARNSGRRLVVAGNLHTQLGPMPVGVPMGVQLAWQRPGCARWTASTGSAGSTTSAARTRSCKWAWPYQTDGRPATSGPQVSYLPGTYVEEITSPRSCSRSSTPLGVPVSLRLVAPARVRRTVDLGRVEDCLKLLSMRASFNALLAHPAHPCDARRSA